MSHLQTIVIIILSAALVGFLNFFLIQNWIGSEQSQNSQMINDAYEKGLEDAIRTIFANSENCQPVTLYVENNTKQVIDVSCLNIVP